MKRLKSWQKNLIFAAVVLAQLPVEEWRKCRSASRK